MAALLGPLFLVDVPPLLDYPNHMARMFVLAFGPGDPVLSRMYAPRWAIIPNLALDLLIPPALRVLPLHVAGRMAVGCAILLPVAGCLALSRAMFGARPWWALASAIPAYNLGLRLGLLNFLIALGLALLVAAGWVAWRERRPGRALAIAAFGAPALFFCHLMGLVLLGVLLSCREAEHAWRARSPRLLLRRMAVLAALFAVPALLFAFSRLAGTWSVMAWDRPTAKLYGAFAAFVCESQPLDVAAGMACFVAVYLSLRQGWGESPRWMLGVGLVLAVAYILAPNSFKGTSFFATRFAIMAGFLLFAGVRLRLPPRAAYLLAAGVCVLFLARMAVVCATWWPRRADLAELRQTIAPVPAGARVLVVAVTAEEAPAYWAQAPAARRITATFQADLHEAALLLTEHRAFWPALFAIPGQQPLVVLPPFDSMAAPQGEIAPHRVLSGTADAATTALFPVPADWQRRFDYVLLLDAGGESDLQGWAGQRLLLLRQTDAAALFRVLPPA